MIKIGLALGGGGARGLAHIGVLKIFKREKIPIYNITGCSIGSIIGGAYAYFNDIEKTEQLIRDLLTSSTVKKLNLESYSAAEYHKPTTNLNYYLNTLKRYFSMFKTLGKTSVYDKTLINEIFESFPDSPIENLPIKFVCIATDLISGREIVINEGSLRKAVIASSSIPGIFPPVEIGNQLLIDGAATDSIPVQIVRGQGVQYVFAVDVTKCLEDRDELDNGLKILYRSEDIVTYHLTQERLAGADLIIRPKVRHFSWASITQIDEIIKAGENAAEEALPTIEHIFQGIKQP